MNNDISETENLVNEHADVEKRMVDLFETLAHGDHQTRKPKKKTGTPEQLWCVYEGGEGPGAGKHIVLIAGDDEYRSEESMPMLGKILAKRHGFKCTVLFPINPESNAIEPSFQTNIPGMKFVDSADLLIVGLRFRNLPDDDMKHFVDYVESGKPIIGFRTSTHAFKIPKESKYHRYTFNHGQWKGGFGRQVLGDTWINHHGHHKKESTRGVVVAENKDHPILKGVDDVWGPTDVYGVRNLTEKATILLDGQVLDSMKPDGKPVEGAKNDPMMPLAWVKDFKTESGKTARIFNTTMGSSTDFQCEDLRRLIVNAAYWCTEMDNEITGQANVDIVGKFEPTPFGFGNFRKGLKPSDFDMK